MNRSKLDRPRTVTAAVLLVAGTAILDIGPTSAHLFRRAGLHWFPLAVTAAMIAASCALLYALHAGHRWARVVVLVFTAMGLPRALFSIVKAPAWSDRLVFAMWTGILVAICVLLLSKSSRAWYANLDV